MKEKGGVAVAAAVEEEEEEVLAAVKGLRERLEGHNENRRAVLDELCSVCSTLRD